MQRHPYISAERKQIATSISALSGTSEAATLTGISRRTVQRVVKLYRETGEVERKPVRSGPPPLLDLHDIEYIEALVEQRPDIYLAELRDALCLGRGVHASNTTICRALHNHNWTYKKEFRGFVQSLLGVMNPYPQPDSVLVMDNASIHHFEDLREMVEERGCRLVYLSPYSPDFNPIEEGFSCLKSYLRRHCDDLNAALAGNLTHEPYSVLWKAVHQTLTPENIYGWFRDCGYAH
ncbi:hypothetical protein NLI96_g9707 [Meripilus lineatus]|uniref:Tc1-like transposase DDE domain-containing protein n=1 Tax=Meripilus lineatus TaxID=2056292 RepID=A0AAD5UV91_9APHY|nr:hypothetical protein NLI96_g9707 [Physisporinus lineatus]